MKRSRPTIPARLAAACVVAVAFLGLAGPSHAEPSREARVEAAFIYNFTQFVEWPADAFAAGDSPFVVGVVGDDPLGGALEQAVAGKAANGRPIEVKHFDSVEQIGRCQLLFIPAARDGSLGSILARTAKAPVLTVGESDEFMAAGGAVRVFLEDGHMKFQINPGALDSVRLKASAKLMKLRESTKDDPWRGPQCLCSSR